MSMDSTDARDARTKTSLPLEGLAPPEHAITVEHREQLIFLLREAAELEHVIMCQYLFAAFSMKESVEEGITEEQLAAITRWRGVVMEVARQEMLHFALVQNLLTSIGGAPHLGRPNIPCPARYFPAGVQIQLVPFGERALRHFLYLERPEGMPLEDAEGYAALQQMEALRLDGPDTAAPALAEDERDIVPHAQDFQTVGHLYRAIDIGFAWLTAKLGAQRLFIGPPAAQATAASFGWPELLPVTDLASAHKAVDVIVEQGEGVRGAWREAHFGRFLRVFEELQALRRADPSFEPARPVLTGTVRHQAYTGTEGNDLPLIDDPAARHVADLFNVANEVILLALTRFFAHTTESPAQLATLADVGVGLMFAAIAPLGRLLTRLPFGPSHPGRTAGPTFELFYQSGYLLPHREAAWLLIEERLRQAADLARRVEAEHQLATGMVAGALDQFADRLSAERA